MVQVLRFFKSTKSLIIIFTDVSGSLLHHEANSDLDFTISSLAACKAGAHVRKRYLRRLIDITNAKEQDVGK